MSFQANTISPFTLTNARAEIGGPKSGALASAMRREHLANELRAAQEKMANSIEDMERSPMSARRRILSFLSMGRISRAGSDGSRGLAVQLEASRDQVEMLAARIHELETYNHSEDTLSLSDKPPPDYAS